MYARTSGYDGQNAEFEIYEYDPWPNPNDYITTKHTTIDEPITQTSWTTVWQDDFGRPEFKFAFRIPSAGVEQECENELHVSQDSETKYYAVIVGENAYPSTWADNGFPPVTFPIKGATDFYNALNFPGETHKVLLQNADKSEIKNAITNFKNMMDEGDMFVFYYAGHGWDGQSSYWLVPIGHETEPTTSQMIKRNELYDWLKDLPASRIAVVLISCYSGGVGAYLAKDIAALNDFEILTACSSYESLYEYEARNFSNHLINGLKGAAVDSNSKVNIGTLYSYIKNKLNQQGYTFKPLLADGYFSGDITLASHSPICTSGAKRCSGNLVQTCNAQGSAWETTQDCSTTGYCSGTSCTLCSSNYANCNQNPSDGCEINTNTDSNNCGSCGSVCPGGEACQNGQCEGDGVIECYSAADCEYWSSTPAECRDDDVYRFYCREECTNPGTPESECGVRVTCGPRLWEDCEYQCNNAECIPGSGTILTVCKDGSCDHTTVQGALDVAGRNYAIKITDKAAYNEAIEFKKDNITLDCDGATLNGSGLSIGRKQCGFSLMSSAIYSCYNQNPRVQNCKITKYDADTGIFLRQEWYSDVYLVNNEISNNSGNGITIWCKYLDSEFRDKGDEVFILNNIIKFNKGWGIETEDCIEHIKNNEIYSNGDFGNNEGINSQHSFVSEIIDNKIYSNIKGIQFGLTKVNDISWVDVNISGNYIYDNDQGGLEINFFRGANINNNNIYSNGNYGLLLDDTDSTIVKENKLCPSNDLDFMESGVNTNIVGRDNSCEKPGSWNDTGTTGCTYSCKEHFNFPLNPGWNLISYPLNLTNKSIEHLSSSINYTKLFSYNNGWEEIDNGHIDGRYGAWMLVNNNGTYKIEGLPFETLTYEINEGWNLINYPSLTKNSAENFFFEVREDINKILIYNGTWESYERGRPVNSPTILKPGVGIWVNCNKNTTWMFDGLIMVPD